MTEIIAEIIIIGGAATITAVVLIIAWNWLRRNGGESEDDARAIDPETGGE